MSLDVSCLTVAISSQPASLCVHICSLTSETPCGFLPEVSELSFHSSGQQDWADEMDPSPTPVAALRWDPSLMNFCYPSKPAVFFPSPKQHRSSGVLRAASCVFVIAWVVSTWAFAQSIQTKYLWNFCYRCHEDSNNVLVIFILVGVLWGY